MFKFRRDKMAYRQAQMNDSEWPELLGKTWQESESVIRKLYPNISIQVVPENTTIKVDYQPERVRLCIDGDGHVTKVPRIG